MSGQRSAELAQWLAIQRDLAMLIAHDLRNPLAAVFANLNYLELTMASDSDSMEAVADMKLAADGLLRLVDNMVAVARLEALSLPIPSDGMGAPLGELVQSVLKRNERALASANVVLDADIDSARTTVRGERALIDQLLDNLVSNVLQHLRSGQRGHLSVRGAPDGVALILTDDGPPFGSVERDFSRHGQLELKKASDSRYSRGLALYVVGLIAHASGATLATDSPDGRGHLLITFARDGG